MIEILTWKTKKEEVEIKDLNELLDKLVNIKQENIEQEINLNLKQLIPWLENNFPKRLEMIAHLKVGEEFTPQQIREQLIRDLKKLT